MDRSNAFLLVRRTPCDAQVRPKLRCLKNLPCFCNMDAVCLGINKCERPAGLLGRRMPPGERCSRSAHRAAGPSGRSIMRMPDILCR